MFSSDLSPMTRREITLTMFSLDPSMENYNLVREEAELVYGVQIMQSTDEHMLYNGLMNGTHNPKSSERHVYQAPCLITRENGDLDETLRDDIISIIGAFRKASLSFDDPWRVLSLRCFSLIISASNRHDPVPLLNLERDYSAGVTFIPDEEFYEPGYIPVADSDSETSPCATRPVPRRARSRKKGKKPKNINRQKSRKC